MSARARAIAAARQACAREADAEELVASLLELVREEREATFRIRVKPTYVPPSPSLPAGPEDYAECADCAAKPGCPMICPACLHNRTLISNLRQRLMAGAAETELSRLRARVQELEDNLAGTRDALRIAHEHEALERNEARRVLGFARDNIAGLTKLARDGDDDRRRLAARIVELEALSTAAPVPTERTIDTLFDDPSVARAFWAEHVRILTLQRDEHAERADRAERERDEARAFKDAWKTPNSMVWPVMATPCPWWIS